MNFHKVGFIGFGLIGASIAKKIKELYPDTEILALAHSNKTIELANSMGILKTDKPARLSDFSVCDLIFLCAPVENNIQYLNDLKPIVSESCLITDVGSTKEKIHLAAEAAGLSAQFIGGHPMTGSEKTGVENSDPALLVNAYYVLTPAKNTPAEKLNALKDLVVSFGSLPLVMDYHYHDRATAAISHLPHMMAFSLVHLVEEADNEDETMKTIAAGSFRDMTRVAASSPQMWESITSTNRVPLLEMMDRYMEEFQSLRNVIAHYDGERLNEYFASAKEYRDSLSVPNKSSQNRVWEIYLDLNDEAGQIAIIATILAFKNINIKNIGIINNREFEQGVLRIEFYDEASKLTATDLLRERNYTVYLR